MRNSKFYFLIIGFIFLTLSCKKLDEQPISFVEPNAFYTTPSQLEATFAASMNTLWNSWSGYGYGMGYFVHDD